MTAVPHTLGSFRKKSEGRTLQVADRFCAKGDRESETDTPGKSVLRSLKQMGTRVTRPSNIDADSFRAGGFPFVVATTFMAKTVLKTLACVNLKEQKYTEQLKDQNAWGLSGVPWNGFVWQNSSKVEDGALGRLAPRTSGVLRKEILPNEAIPNSRDTLCFPVFRT